MSLTCPSPVASMNLKSAGTPNVVMLWFSLGRDCSECRVA
jgi:hypothetical protein